MSEQEKMLNGDLYDARDPALIALFHRARKLLSKYNTLDSEFAIQRKQLLEQLFADIGDGAWIEAPFFCDYGTYISIGHNTFVNANCMFQDNNRIAIGNNVLFGPFVQIYTASHPLKASERIVENSTGSPYRTSSRPVTIGDNVWIGGNSVILPGVTIGNNVTIGAGSVVTKNIPDDVLALGNPCKVQRELK